MEMKKLAPKTRSLWLLQAALYCLFPLAGAAILGITLSGVAPTAVVSLLVVLFVLLAVWILIYPFLNYRFYSYGYNDRRIVIRHGVVFRHEIVIPICQIQDFHRVEGPLMTLFGVNGIIFSTAGSNFTLNGLSREDAAAAVSFLEEVLNQRVAEKAPLN